MDATGGGPAPAYPVPPSGSPGRCGWECREDGRVPGPLQRKSWLPSWDERRSRRNSTLELNDDRDRTADRKTEIAVRAALVDRDFGKSVRILVPEGRAGRPIAERPRVLQHAARRGELGVGRQHRRAQAGHGIAEVIDVDDFGEVVRPV